MVSLSEVVVVVLVVLEDASPVKEARAVVVDPKEADSVTGFGKVAASSICGLG